MSTTAKYQNNKKMNGVRRKKASEAERPNTTVDILIKSSNLEWDGGSEGDEVSEEG